MPRKKKAVDARSAEEEERVLLESVRAFAHQRLSAAVEEIFQFFQSSVCDYEANLDKYGRFLDSVLQPELRLHRVDGEAPSARPLTGASQENGSSEDEEDEAEDEDGDEMNDKVGDEDEDDDDDDEGASGREEGDVGEEVHESDAPSPEEDDDAMDNEEVHEMKALQPELSMKPGEKKPRGKVRPPEPRRTRKTAKPDATELLGRLKLEVMDTGVMDSRLMKTSACVAKVT